MNRTCTTAYQRGFSLMELMLVFLLIGIASGGVVIALGNFASDQDRLYDIGRKLFAQMQFVQDEALIQQRAMGLSVGQEGVASSYEWKRYSDKKWEQVNGEPEAVDLPEGMILQVTVDDQLLEDLLAKALNDLTDDEQIPPAVIFYPNSDVSEFSLTLAFADNRGEHSYRIYVDERGQLTNSQVDQTDTDR